MLSTRVSAGMLQVVNETSQSMIREEFIKTLRDTVKLCRG